MVFHDLIVMGAHIVRSEQDPEPSERMDKYLRLSNFADGQEEIEDPDDNTAILFERLISSWGLDRATPLILGYGNKALSCAPAADGNEAL
jgi:hypothetical protein